MDEIKTMGVKKKLIYFWLLIFIVFLILLFYYFKFRDSSTTISADRINVYSANVDDGGWSETVTIRVDMNGVTAKSYSFDGGVNWQDSNEFVVTKNGKIDIIVMDLDGNKSEKVEYVVDTIDTTPPIITVKLPKEILLNEKINLKDYVKVTDNLSGVNGDVIINPNVLDTSKVGEKSITFTAKDNVGNINSIYVKVNVVSKKTEEKPEQEDQYVTMYRYRVKKMNTYNCKTYDCSYYNDSDIVGKVEKFVETGKCNNDYNKKMTFRNGCYITPGLKGSSCTAAIITVDRYTLYENYIIDIIALNKDGSQDYSNKDMPSKDSYVNGGKTDGNLSGSAVLVPSENNYKAAPCGTNEIEIYGYCHAICSKPAYTCPDGYKLVGGSCKKYVQKTCYEDCTTFTWSEWSEWSETEIIATEEIQVETKSVKR